MSTLSQDEPDTDLPLPAEAEKQREKHFWERAVVVALLGLGVLVALGSALLSISHAPTPHEVPLAYVGPAETAAALSQQAGEALDIRTYDSRDAAVTGIGRMEVYGALVVGPDGVELLKSTASAPQVASTLTTLVSQQSTAGTPTITEITPLPAGDSGGGSLAVMIQVTVLVGTIGSVGLGRLVPRYRANWTRGELPVLFLALYALCVGASMAGLSHAFGAGDHVHYWKLALSLALVNLAVTASVSGLVCLIGSAGAAVGGILYFLLGLPISGAATALPLLPAFWRDFGQALPPGAAATLLRRVLYFPDAPIGGPLLVLGLYAGIGVLVVGVVNLLAGAHHRNSLADLP
ncbi:membrane protein [Kineosporia sp. NBRC 101677]|uniref:ABC transporter permease n=1 Tax=Kineosporia sp. NBRC 101677 TaxID=3032197 RepID=UPI0024A46E77|nr:ABC transporter permease [Kineosporia sp. NBRC 101677]GLY14931.1 membrane protein [Kineosporia sp. NBRC 101677]